MGEFFSDLKMVLGLGVLKRIGRRILEKDYLPLAGGLAYFFVLFLFPFLMFLVSLMGMVIDDPEPVLKALTERAQGLLPGEVVGLLEDFLARTLRGVSPLTLGFAALMILGTGSAVSEAITRAANRAYGVAETRSFWKVRGLSVLLILEFTLLIAVLALVVFGPEAGDYLQRSMGLPDALPNLFWRIAGWLLALLAVTLALDILYYVAPNADLPFSWITPGGLVATILLIITSEAIRFWMANVFRYNQLYGQLGAGIVLLIWLYAVGLMVLVGLEMNAVLVRMTEEREGVELVQGENPAGNGDR